MKECKKRLKKYMDVISELFRSRICRFSVDQTTFFALIFADFFTKLAVVGVMVDGFFWNFAHNMRHHVLHKYFLSWNKNIQSFLSYEFFKFEKVDNFEVFRRNFIIMAQVFVVEIRNPLHVIRWKFLQMLEHFISCSFQGIFNL